MFEITVDKGRLLEIVEKNMNDHRATFEAAQEKYRAAIIEELDRRLALARENKFNLDFRGFIAPTDHTEDYVRVIGMLNMSNTEEIVLGEEEYTQYVLDLWAWSRQWSLSNVSYLGEEEYASRGYNVTGGKFGNSGL